MRSIVNKYLAVLQTLILSVMTGLPVTAQSYEFFHHLHTWSDEIKAIYPDASGRIWIGTIHGLMRYGDFPIDSNSYGYYPEEFRNGVYTIHDFDDNFMLIQISDGGKHVLYNPNTNKVSYLLDNLMTEWGINLKNRWSLKIRTDNERNIWFYADGKLYVRLISQNKTVKIADLPNRILNLSVNSRYFCFLTDETIYVYSRNGLKPVTTIAHKANADTRVLKIDDAGNIWVGGDNLLRYDSRESQCQLIRKDVFITDMVMSHNGDILVSTNSSGLLRYDKSGKLLQEIRHIPYNPNSLASDNIRYLAEDADTTLWICYDKRVISACNPRTPDSSLNHIINIKSAGFEDDIIAIRQDYEGNVWMGSNGNGLFRMDSDGRFSVPNFWKNHEATVVTDIYFDSQNRMWVATYRDGIYCIKNTEIHHYLPKSSVYSTFEDAAGHIWFGLLGGGIYFLDTNLNCEPERVNTNNHNWILKLTGTDDGNLYAASSNGIIKVDVKSRKCDVLNGNRSGSKQFKNYNFQSIYKDSRGLYWLIGQDLDTPLEIYDAHNDTVFEIPRLKGHVVKSVIEDDSKNIWIASEQDIIHIIVNYDTTAGRYVFIPSFYRFRSSSNDKFGYYNYRAAEKLDDGRLLFGSSDGYRIIDPKNYPPHVSHIYAPDLYIASVKINGSYLKAGNKFNGRDIIDKDISAVREINLAHNENNLIITVGTIDLTSSYQTDIYYRLKGRDSEWRPVRANVIELSDLASGKYVLEVCSEKADGNMSENILTLGICVDSPWYASIWAWSIYIIFTIAAIIMAIYYFLDRQKQQMYVTQIKKEADRQYQLNEMKLRFFTNVSHDFRTPLSLIITPLEAFLSDESNKASEKYLRPVYKNAVRLLNLINQILDFRKIDVNGAVLNLSYGDIVSYIREICSSFTLFAEDTEKNIRFESEELVVNMYFDKDKISKIMMNLLSNSFKFTKPGSTVGVKVFIEGDLVGISVTDNGPGIPDSQKSKIFERFYQSGSNPSGHMGSGIGLHIVKEFVALHKGSVAVSDNHPSGAIFTLKLPIVKNIENTEDPTLDSDNENHEEFPVSQGQPNLLLVEDNADFREFMKNQLSDEYRIFMASNGAEALEVLDKQEIRVIVSDVMMDGMDGLELCRKVKSNLATSHIPVILLTAKALAEDEMMGFDCGADEYITKPFNMSILRHRIKKLIDDSIKSQKKFKEKLDVNLSELTITSLDEQFLSNAIKCVEDNMSSADFSVETMSSLLGVHRTQLYKKLINLTGKSPVEFIRLIRLKRAAQYLAKSQMFISEIAYTVGFSSPKLFTKHFKDEFGMSPRDYQNECSGNRHDAGDKPI